MRKRKASPEEIRQRLRKLHTAIKNHLEDYEHHFDLWVGQPTCWINVSDARLMRAFARSMDVREAARRAGLTLKDAESRLVELVTLMRRNRLNYLKWLIEVVRNENRLLTGRPQPPVRRIESGEPFVPVNAFFKRTLSGVEENSMNMLMLSRKDQSLFVHELTDRIGDKNFQLPEERKKKKNNKY